MTRAQPAMLLAAEEELPVANAFAFRHVHTAMVTAEHAFERAFPALAGLLSGRPAPVTRPVQGTTHPPDADQNEDEEEQVSHDEGRERDMSRRSLARGPRQTCRRRSQAAASVASFFAKQKRITRSSRPSAKKADTGIAATPVARVSRCTKAVSGSSEIAP